VHEHSLALVANLCFLAVGPFIVSLDLPLLTQRWVRQVDSATCFGIHVVPDERSLMSHGEMVLSRLTDTELDSGDLWG